MRRQDITRFYTLLFSPDGQALQNTIAEARKITTDQDRIWFVREGDRYDWDVEPFDGQFVNCLGFFVTLEPCRADHRERIFKY
jgi:hypothetical protein